ncbi:MAG: thiamine pyrophosphate-binding protein [Deltaproteobacteria bacterium]|nr:thiamine pyrophosphate-binding protein [Deltaproteobacteria bacterium]
MESRTGGEIIARMLAAEGVEVVFGIIDGTYYGLTSVLADHGIRLVTPRHESTAAHMAGAYARMTGRLGVCLASNGPGVANVLPGIAVENGEGNRVLVVSSWRRSAIVGPDRGGSYQYFDQVAVVKPMSKWAGAARSADRIPEIMQRAFRTAFRGRPGVVFVTIPEDVMNEPLSEALARQPIHAPVSYRRTTALVPDPDLIRHAAARLAAAERPLVHAGSGVLHGGAAELLEELVRTLAIPVTASFGGRPALDERLPNAIPLLPPLIDEVRGQADVVLALGTRLGETDWWGKPRYWGAAEQQAVIQVDCDEEVLGMNKPVALAILSDVAPFLEALLAALKQHDVSAKLPERRERLETWNDQKQGVRAFLRSVAKDPEQAPMHTAFVPIACGEFFDDDAILVVDGGNTAVWTNLLHENRVPGSLLSTFKFGMLGAGVGQALGAKVAFPERQVYAIVGDGAMGFHPQEIETAVRNDLRVVYLVLCDRQWGMVKFGQSMANDPDKMMAERSLPKGCTLNTDFEEIRFDDLARAMGAHGERVERASELRPALERSVASGKPAVIHVDVDPVEHMWAPGLDVFKAMHMEPEA